MKVQAFRGFPLDSLVIRPSHGGLPERRALRFTLDSMEQCSIAWLLQLGEQLMLEEITEAWGATARGSDPVGVGERGGLEFGTRGSSIWLSGFRCPN